MIHFKSFSLLEAGLGMSQSLQNISNERGREYSSHWILHWITLTTFAGAHPGWLSLSKGNQIMNILVHWFEWNIRDFLAHTLSPEDQLFIKWEPHFPNYFIMQVFKDIFMNIWSWGKTHPGCTFNFCPCNLTCVDEVVNHHCCVAGCNAGTTKWKKPDQYPWMKTVKFHTFPKALGERHTWLQLIWREHFVLDKVTRHTRLF